MLSGTIPQSYMESVKRHLNITWSDEDTDAKLTEMMMDAEQELNHTLGAEIDYFSPGMERRLYLDYMLYAWNDCLNEFDAAYRAEIYKIRHRYEVEGVAVDEETVSDV